MDISILMKKYREYENELFILGEEKSVKYGCIYSHLINHSHLSVWRRRVKLEICLNVISKLIYGKPSEEEINNLTYI